ncbi:MAG: hypothetical protein ACD_40C00293G0003 [uncultured bacterium]|nr:MAG: hypothetical protein ACD_40C00293G0003 [uncultured bacterium]
MGAEDQYAKDYQKAVGCYGDLRLDELLQQIEMTENMASKFAGNDPAQAGFRRVAYLMRLALPENQKLVEAVRARKDLTR